MKKFGILVTLLVGSVAISGCGKSSNNSPSISAIGAPPIETTSAIKANHSVKAINLRQADAFAILAHQSISSIPTSAVTGKVGLRPGTRDRIGLNATEVIGGAADIYANDDRDVSTVAYVTQAKIDLINAYNEAETTVSDSDKIDLYGGALGNKILPAGVYKWNSRVTIPNDLTLEGSDTDVWVFQVAGDLRIGSDVTIKLSGGALAKNVFWQVGDNVLIKSKSAVVGTIMSQLSLEMKEQSTLIGRAFSKNEKIILDKNTITRP